MKFKLGFTESYLTTIEQELNVYLSNLSVFYMKLHNFHWNIKGPQFFQLHVKFEEFYTQATLHMDQVAERILALGLQPVSTLSAQLKLATIQEVSEADANDFKTVDYTVEDFSILIGHARTVLALAEENKDTGTSDLMTQLIAYYEQNLWMMAALK